MEWKGCCQTNLHPVQFGRPCNQGQALRLQLFGTRRALREHDGNRNPTQRGLTSLVTSGAFTLTTPYGSMANFQVQFIRNRNALPITRNYMTDAEDRLAKRVPSELAELAFAPPVSA